MRKAARVEYYIGIDPDVQASGLAIWDAVAKAFIDITCEDLPDVCIAMSAYHEQHSIVVRIEAGWLIKGNWHKGGSKRSGNAVGRNHEIGRQIEKYCIKHTIPYELVKPQGYSSFTHELFCSLTGWPITLLTNSDKRVAGMMVYGY